MVLPLVTSGSTGAILKTTDGGKNWSAKTFINYAFNSVYVQSPLVIYAVAQNTGGSGGAIFKTTDGGVNWTILNSGMPLFYSVAFPDTLAGYAAGLAGSILNTVAGSCETPVITDQPIKQSVCLGNDVLFKVTPNVNTHSGISGKRMGKT